MRIIKFEAENFKRLQAVEIAPDGSLVQITGRNGAGKSSILDAIWVAFAGKAVAPTKAIRKGQEQALIRIALGKADTAELIVTRRFRHGKEGAGETTDITVENAEGMRAKSPQALLDSLFGELSFDPLAFARMEPREQLEALRRFVPGVDFQAIDDANRKDYEARTGVNRREKEARTTALGIAVPEGTPDEPIDTGALTDELEAAGNHNADIEKRKANRAAAAEKAAANRETARTVRNQAVARDAEIREKGRREAEEIAEEIKRLQAKAAQIEQTMAADIARLTDSTTMQAGALEDEADELDAKIAAAPALPEPIDPAAIRQRITEANATNAHVAAKKRRAEALAQAESLKAESDALTAAMTARTAQKEAAIASAELPIAGIGFGDGEILMGGVPFSQASSAEQLRASVAIAIAANPKLKVIRIKDGSLLDDDGLALVAKMAADAGAQVWIERVSTEGKVGFVIEDGRLKGDAAEKEQAA